jgi:L-fuculose-phosphate aldolase
VLEYAIRKQLVTFAHRLYERGYLVAMDGNVSARLQGGNFLVSRTACHKGFLEDRDLVVVDAQGRVVRGEGKPTSELWMHLACYEERPDVRAILHAHPPQAIAFTLADTSLERLVLPEVVLTLGTVPTVPYVTTGTKALADALRPFVRDRDVVMMDRHGAVALGTDVLDAFCKLETLEHTAKILLHARTLGGAKELPADEAVRLRSMGLLRYGGPPAAVALARGPTADLSPTMLRADDPYPEPGALLPRVPDAATPFGDDDPVARLARAIQVEVATALGARRTS